MGLELESSVAAVLKADGSVAGTAFLFRKGEEFCYWFTCQHVVSGLTKLQLGLNFSDNAAPEAIDAEYVPEHSRPEADVAVLRTKLEQRLKHYESLPMGDVLLKPGQTEDVTSIGFTPRNVKNFITGQVFSATLAYGQKPKFFIHDEEAAKEIRALANSWNIPLPSTTGRSFNLSSAAVEIEGGFSGSPVCVTMTNGQLLCVGMINQAGKVRKDSGTAIAFTELFDAAGIAIPFYPYANCIIIVVAAKSDELDQNVRNSELFRTNAIAASYDDSRNKWRLFDKSEDVSTIVENIEHRFTWQLATIYLDDQRELEAFIKYTPQALFFIIDSCSFDVPALKTIIEESDSQFYRAAYLFPMCDCRFDSEQKELLRKEQKARLPRVFESAWVTKRRGECFRRQDFVTSFVLMIEEAVKQSMLLHQDEVARLLEQANIPPGGTSRLPIINMGGQPRG